MTILPPAFLVETARALTYGAGKYDRTNYLRVEGGGQRYAAALLRHLVAWMGGEDNDPESGLHHLSCASANLAMMISCDSHGVDIGSWREQVEKPIPPLVVGDAGLLSRPRWSVEGGYDWFKPNT